MKDKKTTKVISKDPPFYQLSNGTWCIDQDYTHKELGRMHVRKNGFRTKGEAKNAYPSVLADAIARIAAKKTEVKFARQLVSWEQFAENWKEERLGQVRGNTWKSKDFPMMNKYFNPVFKGLPIKNCFTEEKARILKKAILNARTQFGDAVPTVDKNRAIAFYLAMLEFASENDYIVDDTEYRHCKAVMKRIRVSDETECGHKRVPIALTMDQVNLILLNIDYLSTDYLLTKILFFCGFRVGEALALKVEDIDLENRIVDMSHILAPDADGEVKRFTRAKTKNGIRKVPITAEMAEEIAKRIDGEMLSPSDYVFHGIKPGKPLDRSAYARRLAHYCKAAGVPVISPHAARHTFSTIAHEKGYRPEVIAMVLGHTTIIDVNVYNHLASEKKAREMVETMYGGTPTA